MEFFVQCGFGMQAHCVALLESWGKGHFILSPADTQPPALRKLAKDLKAKGGTTWFDPQFYLPHADREKLTSHEYWPKEYETSTFWDGDHITMLKHLAALNAQLGTSMFVVPGQYGSDEDSWLKTQELLHVEASKLTKQPLVRTVCLSQDFVKNPDIVHEVVEFAQRTPVPWHYLVLERDAYLTNDPVWLSNAVDLVASLRLSGAKVVVGYSNQQSLVMAAAGANAIASGKALNTRRFDESKFFKLESDPKRSATWYYLPQALSEFRTLYLDLAANDGNLDKFWPNPESGHLGMLLAGGGLAPTASGWEQGDSARHFMDSLRLQAARLTPSSFDAAVQAQRLMLKNAEKLLDELHGFGYKGDDRDYADVLGVHDSALTRLENVHGARLRRAWPSL